MKKLLAALLAATLAVSSFSVSALSADPVRGDTNGDGELTIKDATIIQKHIAGMITLKGDKLVNADKNIDGHVLIDDATQVQREVALIERTPEKPTDDEVFEAGQKAECDFAAKLLKNSDAAKQNVLVSPLSVMEALGMTTNGAGKNTLRQMEDVLGMPLDTMNRYFQKYPTYLRCSYDGNGKPHIANSLWYNTMLGDMVVNDNFTDSVHEFYDSELYKLPFDGQATDKINDWVSQNTDGMIPHVIDSVSPSSLMCLVNALSFDGKWLDEYTPYSVYDGVFHNANGSTSTVEMMNSDEWSYIHDDMAQGFIKPFEENHYSFVAVLPNENVTLSQYLNGLTGERLQSLLNSEKYNLVYTKLPKFTSDYSVDLAELLKGLGMTDAFDPVKADFNNMLAKNVTGLKPYIGSVIHKTTIDVNEHGTKAAAATVVDIKAGSVEPKDPKRVYLDRPFLYMLVNNNTDTPFFIGTVTNL